VKEAEEVNKLPFMYELEDVNDWEYIDLLMLMLFNCTVEHIEE
jgi:hypothetical protein